MAWSLAWVFVSASIFPFWSKKFQIGMNRKSNVEINGIFHWNTKQQDHRSAIQVWVHHNRSRSVDQQSVQTNSSKCNLLAKSSEELEEINGIFHQTIGNTVVHNQTDKSSNSSEMQSSNKTHHSPYTMIWYMFCNCLQYLVSVIMVDGHSKGKISVISAIYLVP